MLTSSEPALRQLLALALSELACGRSVEVAGADHRVPLVLCAIVPEVVSILCALRVETLGEAGQQLITCRSEDRKGEDTGML